MSREKSVFMQGRQARPETKVRLICEQLSELAFAREPNARMPTIRELCISLGTTRATLDEALSLLEQQHIIYRKHGSGIFVSPKLYRKRICILLDANWQVSSGASPFWGLLWGKFAQEAQKRSAVRNEYYTFHLVVHVPEQELALPDDVIGMIKDGMIHGVLATGISRAAIEWIQGQGVPCVGFAMPNPEGHLVALNHEQLMTLAVEKLAGAGCQRIALWAPSEIRDGREEISRWGYDTSFMRTLNAHGIHYRSLLVRDYISPPLHPERKRGLSYQEQGYLIACDVFNEQSALRPDGIFIVNDMMTDGALAAFQALGIRVGEDVSIATHANAGTMMTFNYISGMFVIEFEASDIVQTMFGILDKLLAGQGPAQGITYISPRIRP